jgi:hypothetical protein
MFSEKHDSELQNQKLAECCHENWTVFGTNAAHDPESQTGK